MRRASALFLVGVLAFSLLGLAPTRANDSQARQILDHLYMSSGGPIQDLMIDLECSILPPGETNGNLQLTSRDKIFFKRPNKLRDDSIMFAPGNQLNGTTTSYIRDGVNMWVYTSWSDHPAKELDDQPTGSVRIPFFIQRYPQDASKDFSVVGHQSVNGVPATVIKVTTPSDPPDVMTVWVDTDKWVPLKTEHVVAKKPKGTLLRRVLYKDVRKAADGRWFPLQIEIYEDDVLTQVIVYKTLSINTGLQDTLFEPMARFTK
ncbi:MAG TPA: outer membrane lipoprotein-sorting protein [Candidatus Xenobia bacterium]|jgi:outer membrane lipoprotein-sorting protein